MSKEKLQETKFGKCPSRSYASYQLRSQSLIFKFSVILTSDPQFWDVLNEGLKKSYFEHFIAPASVEFSNH